MEEQEIAEKVDEYADRIDLDPEDVQADASAAGLTVTELIDRIANELKARCQ